MERTVSNNYGIKRNSSELFVHKRSYLYSESFMKEGFMVSLRAKLLAFALFLYYFIEAGTLGILPPSLYFIYRNVRISDFILYLLVIYSIFCIKEYRDLFKSKSFLPVKIFLAYLIFEFIYSALQYHFSVLEYFFRLKGMWSSFLILPFLLLMRRGGLEFFIKIIFPVAIISNFLYIATAVTGIALLPDVSIIKQQLPGDIEVYRVFGGTFFGEMFFLGFIYYWISKKFKAYQVLFVIFFMIPHILAFGRTAWAYLLFAIALIIILNSLRKKDYKVLFRQAVIILILLLALIITFIKFIPESDFYVEALNARLFQGQEDVTYKEGTYGSRVELQNNSLIKLWWENNILIGIGMHPFWVNRPETLEEQVYYNSFSDVTWPGILAAYGLIGFLLAVYIQIYYTVRAYKVLKKAVAVSNIYTFFVTMFLSKLLFDSFVTFSYVLLSTTLWGFSGLMNFYIAVFIFMYQEVMNPKTKPEEIQMPGIIYGKYSKYSSVTYKA
jgi:hypothetical protein